MYLPLISSIVSLFEKVIFLFGYIANPNSFPQPLSPEEEARYFESFKNGCMESRNILIERNLRLVAHIVKKFSNNGHESDDLISTGTIGLIKAIESFDYHKGTKLATYAARCIENEILMYLRANKTKQNEVSLQDPIGQDKEGNEILRIDVLGSDSDTIMDEIEHKMEVRKLHSKLSCLKGREKEIIERRYGLYNGIPETQREIAKKLGISRSYVSRIEKKAINKLCKEFTKDN